MPAKKFIIPFAATGDKTAVPNTLQPDGTVSYAQGFGPDYELDKTLDPINAKDVPRDQTNQLYFDLTDAVGEQQLYGVALWGSDRAPYPLNARAYHNDKLWRSNVINNSGEPGVSGWDDVSVQTLPPLPPGYFSGFTMANDGGAPNTTISVGAGSARDSTNANNIELASALRGILQSSGAWAAGDNQNKLDAGARANNTWYHVFAIRKTSDGSADILFSLSPTAPTMPGGYSGFVLIESILTDGSGNILGFLNERGRMTWKTARQDVALTSVNFGNTTVTVSTPPGRRVRVRQYGMVYANAPCIYTHSPDANNETMGYPGFGWTIGISTNQPAISDESIAGYLECETNLASQVVLQTFTTINPIAAVRLTTVGWDK